MAQYILMVAVAGLLVLVLVRLERIMRINQSIHQSNQEIVVELRRIAEGQRLSMVLTISPSSLTIDPEEFEPQRPIIRERLLKAFETEQHPNPGTLAYCILDHSGWHEFVDGVTFQTAQIALGRLLANKNRKKAKRFLTVLVNQL